MVTPTMNGSASTAVETCSAEIREILQAAACGTELTFEQGLLLATAQGSAVEALVAVADELRRETVGDAITYVVNRNINFTNVCFVGCSFCGFGRGPGAADAYSLSFEEVVRRAREAWERGATEVCVQGGLPRDLDGFFYRDLLRAIKHAIPGMHVHAFSPMEIDYGVTKTGMLLREIQKRTSGFTEFVPLGFIHENTRLYRHGGARPGAKREEHLQVHALARVLLHGAIKNLQVSWVKLGFETSLACLQAGANDFSGTLMEESISKAAGATFGEYVSPEEFRARIRSIGRIPAERTTTYKIRRMFGEPEHGLRTPAAQLPMARAESHAPYTEGAY